MVLDLARAACPPPIHAPSGVSVWRLRQATLSETLEAVQTHGANRPATVFVACEAGRMRALRRLALDEWRVPQERVFTSGYWKAGLSSEQVDAAKRLPDWFGDDVGQMTSNRNPDFGGKAQTAGRGSAPS